jgi:hypothetical protein
MTTESVLASSIGPPSGPGPALNAPEQAASVTAASESTQRRPYRIGSTS